MVERFVNAFNKELDNEEKYIKTNSKSNLSVNDTGRLQHLSQIDVIIITKTDKERAVVIIDVDNCIHETNRQCINTIFYKKIPTDPTDSNKNKVNNSKKEVKMQRLVDDQTAKKSSNSGSKNAKFLCLTKNFQTRQFR